MKLATACLMTSLHFIEPEDPRERFLRYGSHDQWYAVIQQLGFTPNAGDNNRELFKALGTKLALESAKMVLTVFGWNQGWEGDETCGYCTLGAIRRAVDGDEALANIVAGVVRSVVPHGVISLWNDHPDQTEECVTTLLTSLSNSVQIPERPVSAC